MQSMSRKLVLTSLVALSLLSGGCRTIGTAGGKAGEVAGDTARAAGDAAGTAAKGAGEIIEDTAGAADDEMR
jgi:hypothetical protein